MPDLSAVIFDLDDTLHRERRFALSGCLAVASHLSAVAGLDGGDVARFLWTRHRRGERATALQALCEAYDLDARMIPGLVDLIRKHRPRLRLPRVSREVLDAVSRQGHRIGVLTNGLPATQRAKVDALGLAPLVDAIVYADACAPGGKPARVCFETALAALDVRTERAVFVGDSLVHDMEGAAGAGLRTVWLTRNVASSRPSFVDATVPSLADVPALVGHLLSRRPAGVEERTHHVAVC